MVPYLHHNDAPEEYEAILLLSENGIDRIFDPMAINVWHQIRENIFDSVTPRPSAIKARLSIEMFRFPRSTSAKKLRSMPTLSANSTWVHPFFLRRLRIRLPKRRRKLASTQPS